MDSGDVGLYIFILTEQRISLLEATFSNITHNSFIFLNMSHHQFNWDLVHCWSEIMAWQSDGCMAANKKLLLFNVNCPGQNCALGTLSFVTAEPTFVVPDGTSSEPHLLAAGIQTLCLSKMTSYKLKLKSSQVSICPQEFSLYPKADAWPVSHCLFEFQCRRLTLVSLGAPRLSPPKWFLLDSVQSCFNHHAVIPHSSNSN